MRVSYGCKPKYLGVEYSLSDNRAFISKRNYEFFPRYKLLIKRPAPGGGFMWIQYTTVNSIKEAKQFIKRNKVVYEL